MNGESDAVAAFPLVLTAAGSLVGFLVAMWSTARQADRERQVEQHAIARALKIDLENVRKQLGPPGSMALLASMRGSTFAGPRIHPWVESMIVQLAASNVEAVAGFMRIERLLHNLSVEIRSYWQLGEMIDAELAEEERIKDALDQASAAAADALWKDTWAEMVPLVGKQSAAAYNRRQLQSHRRDQAASVRDTIEDIRRALDSAELHLDAILREPILGRLPLPADLSPQAWTITDLPRRPRNDVAK